MPTAQQQRERLIGLLKELFQLDQPDLDFGFWRIMHAKAKQVAEFLEDKDQGLLKIIEDAFGKQDATRRAELEHAYQQAIQQARDFGAPEPEKAPAAIKAKAALDAYAQSTNAEAEVYDHLYRFFERYYEGGDFLSRRYYSAETEGKAAAYAIPYDGREVHLHWANADQYYIKTTEYFTNFSFDPTKTAEAKGQPDLFSGQTLNEPMRVHFRVVEATEGEHGNVKATEQQKRFFILHAADPIGFENGELIVRFEYRPDPEKGGQEGKWQATRNEQAVRAVLEALDRHPEPKAARYAAVLRAPAPTEKQKDRPLLAKYLGKYTARNTMDYFIHKDLGAFLRRELDFYIKNEIMRLDDLDHADAPRAESYLDKVRVLRQIARQIIDFLAQLEDFQKKLWLKKKFVVETNWCITLDRILAIEDEKVRDKLLREIAANDAQREEWVRLFAIDELGERGAPGYSVPLTIAFVERVPSLVLDTHFFSEQFRYDLLAALDGLDQDKPSLAVHSENFQALTLLSRHLQDRVKCVYIDPPYNTGQDGFAYKDAFKSSSWAAMMRDRLALVQPLLERKGVLFASINEIERENLSWLLGNVFAVVNRVEELIWVRDTISNNSPTYSTNHEYVEVFARDRATVEGDRAMFRETKPGFAEVMALIESLQSKYPPVADIEVALRSLYSEHRSRHLQDALSRGEGAKEAARNDPWKGLYPYKHAEYRDSGGAYVFEGEARERSACIWVWREVEPSMPAGKQSDSIRDPNSDNYRFYRPPHPTSGEPCSHPKRGWAFPFKATEDRPSYERYLADGRISVKDDCKAIPQLKYFLHEVASVVSTSVVRQYADGEPKLEALFGRKGLIDNPKPPALIERFVKQSATETCHVLDFFAGSGTTGHAVVNLNRLDAGNRSFVLVEMGDYFDTVLLPRLKKVVFAPEWDKGKPVRAALPVEVERSPRVIKYIRLESYEDCLNNLVLAEDAAREKALAANPGLRRDYMLQYMLDVETRGSASLLNIDRFNDPMAYTLKVKKPGTDEYVEKPVDLVETFNYLIGLRVEHMAAPETLAANFTRPKDPDLPEDQHTRLLIDGKLKRDPKAAWWFRRIEGWVPKNPATPNDGQTETVLIIWRKLTADLEQDNAVLDEYCLGLGINTLDFEYDTIYVNGSNNLPNLKRDEDRWKVRLIEEDFHRLMWDVEDV